MTSTSTPGPAGAPATTTLTARSPEDLLALAPVVLGFFPTDSVVMLTFGAAAPFHARVDLPVGAHEVADVVDALVAPARHHGVERVVLLVYGTDRRLAARLWSALARGFERAGVTVVEALRVEQERWYPLTGRDQRAREHGVPFDISAHRFLAQAVLDGRVTHRSRAALAATLVPDPVAVPRLAALASALPRPTDVLAEGCWVEALLAEHLLAERLPSDDELARVLLALTDLRLRDAAWSVLRPDRSRPAVAWWTHAVTRSPDALVAAPAALLAWSAWLHGNGALAWCALDRCEDAEPGYGLARIVGDLLERAHPPSSWVEPIDWRTGLDVTTRAG
jgi:hypothetical protein